MPSLDFALLCNSAMEHNGLVSVLGAGFDRVSAPQWPINIPVTVASRVIWKENELGTPHILRLEVTHQDGEQLARVEGTTVPRRQPDMDERRPVGSNLVVVLALQFRREGTYSISIAMDAEPLKALPLTVETVLPQL